ncbi:MAG: sodium/proline symporter [Bryobacterales bacterium]
MTLLSFGFFLLAFVVIGLLSMLKREQTGDDYLLASQSVQPWLVALSAVATNNSGYMFIGMIGFTYTYGLSSIWLMIGWIVGDFLASLFVHEKLRITTEAHNQQSFAGALAAWQGTDFKHLQILGGILTVLFLGAYAAAQLTAGSKALHVLFGWNYGVGAVIGAVIVLLYCFAGGIRASIWTDAAQSMVMLTAMGLMLWVALDQLGGWSAFADALAKVSPQYMDWFPPDLTLDGWAGPALFVTGWLFAGAAVIGQPHIMVRFMAMDNPDNMWRVRGYYYGWFSVFYAITICVGLAARLLLPEGASFDAELALPTLAGQLLPPVLTGLVLAGLFAATISTADSVILSCTAAITRDFRYRPLQSYAATKGATLFVTVLALAIALGRNESVFTLVLIAWATLASAFGPLMIAYSLNQKPREGLALTMVVVGVATVLAWRALGWDQTIVYEVMPGMLSGLVVFAIGKALGFAPQSEKA